MTRGELGMLVVFAAALVAVLVAGARGDLVSVMTEIEYWIGGR